MRKLLLSLACMLFVAGLVVASEGILSKHDAEKKEVTVKDGDSKEIVLKYTDKTKVTFVDENGENPKEGTLQAATNLFSKVKAIGKMKFEYTADKDGTVSEFKFKARKGK